MKNTVLIVDDAGFMREILHSICDSAGYSVVGEAADGDEAIFLATQLKPKLILLDLVLPKKNGLEVAREVRSRLPSVKIVAISTLDDTIVENQTIQAGCDAFITKPFSRSHLLQLLKEIAFSMPEEHHG